MTEKAFQDQYKDEYSVCYGCGRLNPHGHRIKSYWDGEESVCRFTPQPYHTAIAGYVYGRKITVSVTVTSKGQIRARGQVVAVQLPDSLRRMPP